MALSGALIFATAYEHVMALCCANKKHYKDIVPLSTQEFRPQFFRYCQFSKRNINHSLDLFIFHDILSITFTGDEEWPK